MWSNAPPRTPASPRPPTAPVRTDKSPASTAAATRAMRRSGAAIRLASPIRYTDRQQQCERADDEERAPQARLRLLHRGEGVGYAQGSDGPDAGSDRRGEHPHTPGFGHRCGGKTGPGVQQTNGLGSAPLAGFLAGKQPLIVAHGAAAGGLDHDQQRLGVVALRGNESGCRPLEDGGRREITVGGELLPLRHLHSQLRVDLRAQAGAAHAVDGEKAAADPERHHRGDHNR